MKISSPRLKLPSLKYIMTALGLLFIAWLIFLISITREQSIYNLVGPNENPYWGIAQFRTTVDDFQTSLFRYKLRTNNDVEKIKLDYELLVSKYFIISNDADTTHYAFQQPLYVSTIEELRQAFFRMDKLMNQFPQGGDAVVDALLDQTTVLTSSYAQFVSALGAADVKRRDDRLRSALRDRDILLYSNISVSLFLLVAIFILARSNRNFEKAYQTAQQVAHTKQIFLGAINHELRNPLQTIVSATENISHYSMNRELMFSVLNIDQAVKHIETHMRDLTDFLKLDTNKINLNITHIDLATIINSTIRKFKPKAEDRGLKIISTRTSTTTSFISDEQRVQQIIDNLVENSIKYSTRGVVEIRYGVHPEQPDLQVRIEVHDEGIGFEKDKISLLFSPFFQSQLSEDPPKSGYGMGLAIVRGLIQILGGRITVESEVDRGSVFIVFLPRHPSANSPHMPEET